MVDFSLTEEQFGDLMKLVWLGNYLANGDRTADDRDQPFDQVEQLILAKAEAAGFGDLVESAGRSGQLRTNALFANQPEIYESIADYDDDIFWEELALRLARRDLMRRLGDAAVEAMSEEARLKAERPFLKKYDQEVDRHGIDRLEIVESPAE